MTAIVHNAVLPTIGRIIHVRLSESLDPIPAMVTAVVLAGEGVKRPGLYAMLFPPTVGGAPRGVRLSLTEGEKREREADESLFEGCAYRWYWPPGAHR